MHMFLFVSIEERRDLCAMASHKNSQKGPLCVSADTLQEDGRRREGGANLRPKCQRITAEQTRVHPRLSWGSVHGSYCSNIELGGLTWGFLYVPIMCMHRWAGPRSASCDRTSEWLKIPLLFLWDIMSCVQEYSVHTIVCSCLLLFTYIKHSYSFREKSTHDRS